MISLVLRLKDDRLVQSAVYAALEECAEIQVGEQSDCWLPVVAETDRAQELHAWLESLPGVMFVDVAFVEVVADAGVSPCSGDFSQEPLRK